MEINVFRSNSILLPAEVYDRWKDKLDGKRFITRSQYRELAYELDNEGIERKDGGSITEFRYPSHMKQSRTDESYFKIARSKILKKTYKSFHTDSHIIISATQKHDQAAIDLLCHLSGEYHFTDFIPLKLERFKELCNHEKIDERIELLFDNEGLNPPTIKKSITQTLNEIESMEKISKFTGWIELDMLSSVTIGRSPRGITTNSRKYINPMVVSE